MLTSLKALLILVSLAVSAIANAVVIAPSITITEQFDSNTQTGSYSVNNQSGFQIFAFAVGNNSAYLASQDYYQFWQAANLNENDWNAGVYFGTPLADTSSYPFQDYFAGYNRVNLYFDVDAPAIENGETTGYKFFYSGILPNSPFAAFYVNNNQIGVITGEASVVPIPGAAILFMTGLLGLIRFKKISLV